MHWAASSAFIISSRVASRRPIATFSSIEVLINRLFWNTKETIFIRSSLGISLTSIPPIKTLPFCGSKNREIKLASVVFPPPEGPTKATFSPAFIATDTFVSAFLLPS